jgi:RNA polymerase sigma factor (sigma-70 family)
MCGRGFEVQAWIRTAWLKEFLMLVEVCAHLEGINEIKQPEVRVCELCVQTGSPWVHLRTCQECGVTLCCDSSPNRHATKHAHASDIRSLPPPNRGNVGSIATRMTRLHSTSRVRTRILKSDGTGGANHESSGTTRRAREEVLGHKEEELRKLASEGKRDEFFREIIPLLKPLRLYIKRRLRGARLTQRANIPVLSSVDMLDDVVLEAYEKFNRKPKRLTLEQWLYRLANEELVRYVSMRRSTEKRRESLETLTQTELRTLEEMPITADADGEVWFPEELDDSEYQALEVLPPAFDDTPEQQLERREQILEIIRTLAKLSERERTVFELYVVEGFSKGAVARISGVPRDEVPRIAEKVKEHIRQAIAANQESKERSEKAS